MIWKKEYGTNRKEYYRQKYLARKTKKAVELNKQITQPSFTQLTQPLNIPQPIIQLIRENPQLQITQLNNSTASQLTEFTQLTQLITQPKKDCTAPQPKPKKMLVRVVNKPTLTQLIHQWKSGTNYSCAETCYRSYCNNCWYFKAGELVNYKGGKM